MDFPQATTGIYVCGQVELSTNSVLDKLDPSALPFSSSSIPTKSMRQLSGSSLWLLR